jgi:PEP-CTERM motif
VFDFFSTHAPDGTGVISGGPFNGYVIVNNNDGTVSLVDPTGLIQTIIASGGTRGDFTSPDANNGTLLLSEYDFSYRLGAPGGTFGGGLAAVPEPTSIALFGIMAGGGAVYRWRRRKPAVAA